LEQVANFASLQLVGLGWNMQLVKELIQVADLLLEKLAALAPLP
jgi:hypothetical protein